MLRHCHCSSVQVGNQIVHFGRWHRDAPGLDWSGVGHVFRQNLIRDGPGAAVMNSGSVDCLFEGATRLHTRLHACARQLLSLDGR